MGFLYQCIQDQDTETRHQAILLEDADTIAPAKSDLRLRLERAHMSEAIIAAAEAGHYTSAQLDQLVGLKQELQQTILDQLQGSLINEAMAQLSFIAHSPSNPCHANHENARNSMLERSSVRPFSLP